MVKSELHQLEKLIEDILNDEKVPVIGLPPVRVAKQIQAVMASCSILKEKWIHQLFSSVKEHVVTRYVQYHQAAVTSLSNQVSVKIPDTYFQGIENNVHQLYFLVVSSLEDLLQFLKQNFYKNFDNDYTISAEHYRVRATQVLLLLTEIKADLLQLNIESPLVEAFVLSIRNKLADAKQTGISYRQLDYCTSIIRSVSQWLSSNPAPITIEFAQEIYRQNFNSYHFNQWYQNYLGSIINAASENNRETTILQEIKLLQLVFVERAKIFEPELPAINDQVLSWLQQLLAGQSSPDLIAMLKMNWPDRMPLRFSVTQFALFVRLCHLEGCFPINNNSDILRFFTQHFETKKQLNISFKSFSHAFYGVDQATAAVVRDFLQRMISTLDKIYFP